MPVTTKGGGNSTPSAAETPKYRVREPCFIAPHYLRAGAIIYATGEAASHLEPLNEAAKAKMEEWYEKEYDVVDDKGNTKKVKLNAGKRPAIRAAIVPARASLVSAPPREREGDVVPAVDRALQPDLIEGDTSIFGDVGAEDAEALDPDVSLDGTTIIESNPEPEKTPIKRA